jgi:hypothetical protein
MRTLAAAGVVLAALLVLVAAGGTRAPRPARPSLMQPVDPGEVVPSDLSRRAIYNWATANHAVEQVAYQAANCGRRARCLRQLQSTFAARRHSVVADARMLSAGPGACGQAFAQYADDMASYTSPLGHSKVRAAISRSVMLIWHSCRKQG